MPIESNLVRSGQVLAALLLALGVIDVSAAREPLISLRLGEQRIEGTPLAWNTSKVSLLARDGQVFEFAPDQAADYGVLAGEFRSYSQAEIRGQLLREFGQGFDVSGVGHYLVVHPAGQKDQWAMRFEDLYRSFVHYFTARGWRLSEPQFPLVAVVYPRQTDFLRKAAAEGVPPAAGLLGYYSPQTNRILMFDASGNSRDWTVNAETIVHEAAHQTAFNTGVHSRYGAQPRWVVEGVGTMFEARGVWQSRLYPTQSDRINRGLLTRYRANAASGKRASHALHNPIRQHHRSRAKGGRNIERSIRAQGRAKESHDQRQTQRESGHDLAFVQRGNVAERRERVDRAVEG